MNPYVICPCCTTHYPVVGGVADIMFEGSDEWLKDHSHLSLERICLTCRAKAIECKTCGLEYPAVPRYFYRRTRKGKPAGKFGVRSECKICFSRRASESRQRKRTLRAIGEIIHVKPPE